MQSNLLRGRFARSLLPSLAAGVIAFCAAADLKADDGDGHKACHFFEGPFASSLVPPPTCTSPVGLCTHGQLGGDFPAIYDFTFSTLQSANDPTDPTEFVYTGHSTVTTTRGVIHTNDSGVIHLTSDGIGEPFVTTASIASGTDDYVGATGVFVATGQLNMVTGDAVGTFIAQVCKQHPEGD